MAVSVGAIEATLELKDKMTAALGRATTKIGKMEGTLGKLSSSATNTGRSLTMGLTAPLVGLGGFALKAAVDFESSFAGVRKTVDATEEEFAKLSQGFRDMAKEIPINVNELNRIGEAAGQLGIKKENILAFTRTMADLGVTTNMSAEEAATALARFSNITGMAQEDFDRLGSTIVDLGNNFATTEGEIVEMGLRLAGAGSQIGMTEAEIMGMSAALSSVGIRAEAGGTAMSRVMIDIASAVASGSESVQMFADTAGMSVSAFSDLFGKDSATAMTKFVQGLGKVGDEGAQIFKVLEDMGFANIRTRDSLLRSAGASEMFAKAMKTASKAFEENTALADEAEKRYETVASQLTMLWNNVKDLGIELGEVLIPALMDLVEWAKKLVPKIEALVDGFKNLSPEAQSFAMHFAAIAAVAGPGLIFLGSVGNLATGIIATAAAVKSLAISIGLAKAASMGWIGLGIAAVGGVAWFTMNKLNKELEVLEGNLTRNTTIWREFNGRILMSDEFMKRMIEREFALKTGNEELMSTVIQLTDEQEKLFEEWKKNNDMSHLVGKNFINLRIVSDEIVDNFKDKLIPAVETLTEAQQKLKDSLTSGIVPAQNWLAVINDMAGGINQLTERQQKTAMASFAQAMNEMRAQGMEPDPQILQEWILLMDALSVRASKTGREIGAGLSHLLIQPELGPLKFPATMGLGDMSWLPTLPPEESITFGKRMGQRFTKGWQSVIKNIPQTVTAAFTGGGGVFGAIKAVGSQMSSAFTGSLFATIGEGIAKGGGKFAEAFGSMMGPLGAAIGSLMGPLMQGIKRLFSGRSVERNVEVTVERRWGHAMSEGLKKAIASTAKSTRTHYAAILTHLGEIFDEAGGVIEFGMRKAISATRDLFVMIETNQMTVEQAGKSFNTAFQKVAEAAVSTGEIVGKQFTELITLAAQFGVESVEMLKFVTEQSENTAQGIEKIAASGVKSKAELEDLGLIAVASFEAALAAGVSFTEAVKAHGPAIDAVIKAQTELGLTSDNVAIQELARFQERVQANQILVAAVEALDDTMLSLSRTGSLTSETLAAMERQGLRMYNKLIDAGFDQQQAILMMGPALKTILEAHQKLGLPIDKNTQRLIDQAREAGSLEDKQKSGWAAVESAVLKVVESLDRFINRISGIDRGLRGLPTHIKVQVDIEEQIRRATGHLGGMFPGMAQGGIVTRPTAAVIGEAGPEAVIPLDQFSDVNMLEELKGMRSELRLMPIMLRDALILAR